jgi:hypothetical protein
VTWLLVAAGVVVAGGAAIAVAGRDPRLATGGALVALVFSPFVADPLPGTPELAFRVVAGVLAAYLLVLAARHAGDAASPPLGVPATLAAGAAAFVAGLGSQAVGLPAFGPTAALAAGLACLVIVVPPLARASGAFRLGIALVILLGGGLLVHGGMAGTPPPLELLAGGLALVLVAATAAALTMAAARARSDVSGEVAREVAAPRLPVAMETTRTRRPRA